MPGGEDPEPRVMPPKSARAGRGLLAVLLSLGPLIAIEQPPVAAAARDERRPGRSPAALEPCHLDGLREEVRCGTLRVPRDSDRPGARDITVGFAVVPALAARPAPDPLFVFPGGPGQGASGYGRLVTTAFEAVRETRDLVLIDPRGTSGEGELRCELGDLLALPAAAGSRAVAACAREHSVEPRFYSSRVIAADAEALRRALGYERVNVWGGSYGTRFALVYAALHEERVRAAILDGAIGPGVSILVTAALRAQDAFEQVVQSCRSDAACAGAFPDVAGDLERWIDADTDESFTIADPKTGRDRTFELDRGARIGLVRGALYAPQHAALLPFALRSAASGAVAPMLALGSATADWSLETMALGATLAVLCADEAGFLSAERVAKETAGTFVGDSYARFWLDACAELPALPEGALPPPPARGAPPLAIPALVLSGERDPATPPAAGEEARTAFARSAHVVVPGAGHNVSHLGCVPDLMRAFLDAGDPAAIDPSCVEPLPPLPFALDTTGFVQ